MKIVVGYDGSNAAMEALKIAGRQAKAFDGTIYVLHSLVGGNEVSKDDIENGESLLEFTKSYYDKDGIPCETHLLIRGMAPGEDIVEYAKENEIDMIVIGVRRRSNVGKLLFGSTARFVILSAACPVLTVK